MQLTVWQLQACHRLQALALVPVALLLAACSPESFETDACTETRIVTSEVNAADPSGLNLTARLETEDGNGVPDRVLKFSVRPSPDGSATVVAGARTSQSGEVTVDVVAEAKGFPPNLDRIREARHLTVTYENPDAFNSNAQPNFCSAEETVEFLYTGQFP